MKPFVVLKLPRTGSTVLATTLARHANIECVGELLNDVLARRSIAAKLMAALFGYHAQRDEMVGFVRNFYATPFDPVVTLARGCTLNPFKYNLDATDLKRALPDTACVFLLIRKDIFAQTVSRMLSARIGQWPKDARSPSANALRDAAKNLSIEPRQFVAEYRRTSQLSNKLMLFADELGAPVSHIWAEDLLADSKAVLDGMFAALGCPPPGQGFEYPARQNKVLPENAASFLSNYEELKGAVAGLTNA